MDDWHTPALKLHPAAIFPITGDLSPTVCWCKLKSFHDVWAFITSTWMHHVCVVVSMVTVVWSCDRKTGKFTPFLSLALLTPEMQLVFVFLLVWTELPVVESKRCRISAQLADGCWVLFDLSYRYEIRDRHNANMFHKHHPKWSFLFEFTWRK